MSLGIASDYHIHHCSNSGQIGNASSPLQSTGSLQSPHMEFYPLGPYQEGFSIGKNRKNPLGDKRKSSHNFPIFDEEMALQEFK